ncbi:MAG: hypothetical protein JSU67_00710 [Gammaproteobacteria bacterium]|nr:MAG: hypothetical protein JSU67_00710 [Gammaproteobacteria bacterium]
MVPASPSRICQAHTVLQSASIKNNVVLIENIKLAYIQASDCVESDIPCRILLYAGDFDSGSVGADSKDWISAKPENYRSDHMAIQTTCIGAYPKPDFVKLPDWSNNPEGPDTADPTKYGKH